MSKLSNKLYSWHGLDGRMGLSFWCPGCHRLHSIPTSKGNWNWNGDVDFPTIMPDMVHRAPAHFRSGLAEHICHLIIIDGLIRFYPDCTHSLRGQTVILPDMPDHLQ